MTTPDPRTGLQQLSLFDAPSAPTPAAPAVSDALAPPTPPSSTDTAPAPLPAPRFHHPRAQRAIALGEHRVGYEFRRGRRRSIGFSVGLEGLCVSAPRWVSVAEVEQALRAKSDWILRKLHEQHEHAQRVQAARIEWRDGTSVPFLGDTVIVVLDPRVTGAMLNADAVGLPGVPRMTLHLGLPQGAAQEQIREAVQSWLQRQARRLFEERCRHFAERLGVRVKRLSLSSASTRWGSASADGSVRLNWRLVHFALPVIDYVVTHELAHLREMNHSTAFWEVVRSVLPDFEHSRGVLRSEVLPTFD
jgi:predicted metal-dependent hydrolase